MTIAYLILCHTDPQYIKRLAKKLQKTQTTLLSFTWMAKAILRPFKRNWGISHTLNC